MFFQADLQKELLLLGRLPLADFAPAKNLAESSSPQDHMVSGIVAYLLKQGNLSLAARLSTVLGCLHGDLDAVCTALALAKGIVRIENVPEWIVKLQQQAPRKLSLSVNNGGEEKDDEVVGWLRGIVNVCTLGMDIVIAIIDNYCFAKLLQVRVSM